MRLKIFETNDDDLAKMFQVHLGDDKTDNSSVSQPLPQYFIARVWCSSQNCPEMALLC